jgi:hypothetical protein
MPQKMIRASAPEGNFELNKKRSSAAEAVCAWNSYGTAEAVPFLELRFIHRGSAATVVNFKESRILGHL